MKSDSWPNFFIDVLVAGGLLTRLPVPHVPDTAYANSARAVWAYPVVGALIGCLGTLFAYVLLILGLPSLLTAGLLLTVLIFATGAIHEDGLADVADGFWGGYTPERRLEIMKDSQIGTFGTLALLLASGLRWIGYSVLLQHNLLVIVAIAAMSRACLPALMSSLPHARETGLSRSVGRPSKLAATLAAVIGVAIGGLILGWTVFPALVTMSLAIGGVAVLAHRKIHGQTGDVLGAAQQVSEVVLLTTLICAA